MNYDTKDNEVVECPNGIFNEPEEAEIAILEKRLVELAYERSNIIDRLLEIKGLF